MHTVKRMIDTKELRKTMIDRGFDTGRQMAKAANISENALRRVMKKGEIPSAAVMYALVDTLDIDPQDAGNIFFARFLREA